ncbi:hypothetical protein D4S03_01445 [bacterium]|nr:MAG: hypothetical protein D4S03_01445 [bacterium]
MSKLSKIGFSIFSALVAGGPLGVVLFLNPSISIELWLKIAIVVVIMAASFFLSYYRELSREQTERKADLFKGLSGFFDEEKMRLIMKFFCKLVAGNLPSCRSNIMLIQNNDGMQVLKIKYYHRMENSPDLNCIWEKREGCCGIAWYKRKPNFVDLSDLKTDDERDKFLRDALRTKNENIACTRGILSVISIPLFDAKDSNKIIGTLNCDSKQDATQSGFKDVQKTLFLVSTSKIISQILKIYSIVKED